MSIIDKLRTHGETEEVFLETQCDDYFDFADQKNYNRYYIFLTKKSFIVFKEKGIFNGIQVLRKFNLNEIRIKNNIPEFFTIKKNLREEGTEYENGFIGFTIQFSSTMKGIYFHYNGPEEKKEKEKIIKLWVGKIKAIYETEYGLGAISKNSTLTRYCINCGTQIQGCKGSSANCPSCGFLNKF